MGILGEPASSFRTISLVGLLKISIVVQTAGLQQFWGGVSPWTFVVGGTSIFV